MSSDVSTPKTPVREGERIAKVMARAGLCSRRDAEAWIAAGRVSVNGEVLTSPAFNVGPADEVAVDGEPLVERQRTRLFAFHKPKGLVTTARDPEGRKTVFEALPPDLPRVVTIGRLDINTEGLLLLTNDGGLARVLELPETGWLRRYRVRAHGAIDQEQLDALKDGVTVEGVNYAGIDARIERTVGSNVWMTMGLREGKNREIKRVLEHLGLQVNRLIRISFGPFELADMPEGAVAEVPTRVLRDQLGARLARKADADFEAPIHEAPPPPPPPRPVRPSGRILQENGSIDRQPRREREDDHGERAPLKKPPPPKKRKHISILRAEAREEVEERRRVSRTATKDRKGREVKVERISTVREPEPAPKPVRAAPSRERPEGPAKRAPRTEGPSRGYAARGDRAERADGPVKRAPRTEGPSRGYAARGDRAERAEGPARRSPRTEGPSRGYAPRGDRPERAEGPARRSPRTEGAPRDYAPRGDRPKSKDGLEAGRGRPRSPQRPADRPPPKGGGRSGPRSKKP